MTKRFAVLGAGRIGQVHARAVASVEGAELAAVADPVHAAAEEATRRFGGEIRDIDSIEAATDIDAVIICTPTDTHADLIERFARAGKAIFCEKPIDLSLARVKICLGVVQETGAPLMLGFNRRFDPDFSALQAEIARGTIGNLEHLIITSRDPGAPPYAYIERSGGIFRDMTIHDFDMARWLMAADIDTVFAQGSVLTDPEIGARGDFDTATVVLTTAAGAQCVITNSRRATYGYDQRIEAHGSEGMVSADNHHETRVTVAGKAGYRVAPLENFFMTRYTAAYAAEIESFVRAIDTGAQPETTGHDGMMALVLAEAALKSVAERRVVRVEEIMNGG